MAQAQPIERKNGAARAALKARATDVVDDFVELRKDVNRLAEAANKAARVEVKHARKRLSGMKQSFSDEIGERTERLSEMANDRASYAADKVREHPGAAVGISLGAGLLIGLLLSARR